MSKCSQRKIEHVSDIISEDEMKKWNSSVPVIIKAPTGSGKSFFIKNILYEFARSMNSRILLFLHRRNTLEQFQDEINASHKQDVIKLMLYQTIQNNPDTNWNELLCKYQYVACDEFHYFLSDANYNINTDISFNQITFDAERTFQRSFRSTKLGSDFFER